VRCAENGACAVYDEHGAEHAAAESAALPASTSTSSRSHTRMAMAHPSRPVSAAVWHSVLGLQPLSQRTSTAHRAPLAPPPPPPPGSPPASACAVRQHAVLSLAVLPSRTPASSLVAIFRSPARWPPLPPPLVISVPPGSPPTRQTRAGFIPDLPGAGPLGCGFG
jgi:hypothetical protein